MRKPRIILICLLLMFMAGAASYQAAVAAIDFGSRLAQRILTEYLHRQGITVNKFAFDKAVISLRGKVIWHEVVMQCGIEQPSPFSSIEAIGVNADVLTLELLSLQPIELALHVKDFTVRSRRKDTSGALGVSFGLGKQPKRTEVIGAAAGVRAAIEGHKVGDSAQELIREIIRLSQDGMTVLDLYFEGKTYLSASGTSHAVQIRTVRENAVTRLVLDIADVAELLRYSEQRFTIAELKMAAEYPFRAPRLFALQQQATAQAKSEYSRDPQVPEDAYRHVLWSYLLTKEFGPEFAELVTDAHEDTAYAEGSGDAQMDLKNNAVGRKYALANLPETLVLSRVRTDPQVIKLEGRHAE